MHTPWAKQSKQNPKKTDANRFLLRRAREESHGKHEEKVKEEIMPYRYGRAQTLGAPKVIPGSRTPTRSALQARGAASKKLLARRTLSRPIGLGLGQKGPGARGGMVLPKRRGRPVPRRAPARRQPGVPLRLLLGRHNSPRY